MSIHINASHNLLMAEDMIRPYSYYIKGEIIMMFVFLLRLQRHLKQRLQVTGRLCRADPAPRGSGSASTPGGSDGDAPVHLLLVLPWSKFMRKHGPVTLVG